jgi:hypothetical protein
MKDKCSYADKYKAIYPPRCGCKTCKDKWDNRPIKGKYDNAKPHDVRGWTPDDG